MPPQGILVIAACLPAHWEIRFVDENIEPARPADMAWADAVLISGMHIQRDCIDDINARAHAAGKLTVLGGPSVSASPEYYPDVDILHLGELGDATERIIERLEVSIRRPAAQEVYSTVERTPLENFPIPAYHLFDMRHYLLASIQYSSGCPFTCEFCDIPELYGRNPRLKTPEQVLRELDAIVDAGVVSAVYFVDDNFVANPRAARELLPHLVRWQKERGYPVLFTCEATLNMAQMPDLLEQMREAAFHTVFFGIETPEPDALVSMDKSHNQRLPLLEAVETFNRHGIEVVSGIIMGLDTDHERTGADILDFIREAQIPMLTFNLLYALPKTPLHRRLRADNRLLGDEESRGRVSNVEFKMPYEQVVRMWYETITEAYDPENLLARCLHQIEATYPNRYPIERKVTMAHLRHGLGVMARILWHVGLRSSWKRAFWKVAWPLLRQGNIEPLIDLTIICHHLITFTEDIKSGWHEACFYADPAKNTKDATGALSGTPQAQNALEQEASRGTGTVT